MNINNLPVDKLYSVYSGVWLCRLKQHQIIIPSYATAILCQGRHVLLKSGTAEKFTLFECSLARPHQLKVLLREFILTTCPQ